MAVPQLYVMFGALTTRSTTTQPLVRRGLKRCALITAWLRPCPPHSEPNQSQIIENLQSWARCDTVVKSSTAPWLAASAPPQGCPSDEARGVRVQAGAMHGTHQVARSRVISSWAPGLDQCGRRSWVRTQSSCPARSRLPVWQGQRLKVFVREILAEGYPWGSTSRSLEDNPGPASFMMSPHRSGRRDPSQIQAESLSACPGFSTSSSSSRHSGHVFGLQEDELVAPVIEHRDNLRDVPTEARRGFV